MTTFLIASTLCSYNNIGGERLVSTGTPIRGISLRQSLQIYEDYVLAISSDTKIVDLLSLFIGSFE